MHVQMRISVCAFPTDTANAAGRSCGPFARNRSSHRAAVQRARFKDRDRATFADRASDQYFRIDIAIFRGNRNEISSPE